MDAIQVGNTIAELRKRVGYTQKDLAQRIGISDKAVSKWERGASMPDISCLRKLAILLNTDTESLLAGHCAINRETWHGVLDTDDGFSGSMTTYIYDKPLVYYLIGYFLLLGIRKITIHCKNAREKDDLKSILEDGSKLGVEFRYNLEPIKCICQSIKEENIMLVYGNSLIYGVDLTRFFQRAMQHNEDFALLGIPKHGMQLTNSVRVDENRCIISNDDDFAMRPSYDYSYLPVLFCKTEMLRNVDEDIENLVEDWINNKRGYAEILDRGFVEIKVNSWDDINTASTFVKIIQEKCGMELYCIEEIAWRRGMIDIDQLRKLSQDYKGTAYGEYIESLCERKNNS